MDSLIPYSHRLICFMGGECFTNITVPQQSSNRARSKEWKLYPATSTHLFCLCLVEASHFLTLLTMRPYDCSRSTLISYIVYWSDGLGYRALDHRSRNGGDICQRKFPAGRGIWPFLFKCPGVGIDLLIATRNIKNMNPLRPRPHYTVFKWKWCCFAPFSKRFPSALIVFVSFSPVHTTTRIRIENAVTLYSLIISLSILSLLLSSRQIKVVPLRWSSEVRPGLFQNHLGLTSFDRVVFIIFVPLPKEDKKLYDILLFSWKIKKLSQLD